jgi:hypothetical protein
VTAKAHGGLIDIEGVTVAEVDEKIRLQAIQTWMDPLEMFRQIAPDGVVRKETMNREVGPDAALDVGPGTGDRGVREHDSESRLQPQDIEKSQDAFEVVFTDHTATGTAYRTTNAGADGIIHAAAGNIQDMAIEKPASNAKEVTQTIEPDSSVMSAGGEYSTADNALHFNGLPGSSRNEYNSAHDQIDDYLEQPAEKIHPNHHRVLPAGEALAAPADSYETRIAHEEMSQMSAGECPFLQNRE